MLQRRLNPVTTQSKEANKAASKCHYRGLKRYAEAAAQTMTARVLLTALTHGKPLYSLGSWGRRVLLSVLDDTDTAVCDSSWVP